MKAPILFTTILLLTPSALSATVLFDFHGVGDPIQAGWASAPLGNGTSGAVSVTTTAIGGAPITVDTRNRIGGGPGFESDGGAEPDMWNDFVFADESRSIYPGTGLSVAISGLSPNTIYPIIIWAFDDASEVKVDGLDRSADWSGGGGSATLSFGDGPDPTSLSDYNGTFNATTDGLGNLTLTGVVAATDPSSSINVFINGLEIGPAVPEPSSALLSVVALAALALRRRR